MAFQNGRNIDPRQLRQILIAMYLREMLQGQQGSRSAPQGQPPDRMKQLMDSIRKGRNLYKTGKSVYAGLSDLFGSGAFDPSTATSSTQAAWNAGADKAWEAQNAAWNAAADKASGIESGATTTPTDPASGSYLAAAASVLNSGRRFMATPRDEQQAYEASMALPRAVAAFYTFGGSELAEGLARKQWGGTMKKFDKFMTNNPMSPVFAPMQASKLWTSDKWKTEGKRVKKLLESGVDVPEQFRSRMYQPRGLKKSELINPNYDINFQGMTKDGYVNNKFENSRNEADMTYETLAPYAVWAEKRNDWWKLSDAQRRAITDAAQKAGAIREHHGTVDVDWDKVGDIDQLIKQAPGQAPAFRRPGKGQVARVSAGMYMNDKGQVQGALTSNQAMQQNYGNRIPRRGNR